MSTDLDALLRLQEDDRVIRDIEARREAIAPQLAVLEERRRRLQEDLTRTASQLQREQLRVRELEGQLAAHRERQAKHQAVLDQAQKLKEATAALAQVESTRKVVVDAERDWLAATRRVADLQTALAATTEQQAAMMAEQAESRAALGTLLATLSRELEAASAQRATSAQHVSSTWRGRYDRLVQRRRGDVLFPLHGDYSCGSCDTAIPKQRRPTLAAGGVIDVCEDCGALVYVPVPPVRT